MKLRAVVLVVAAASLAAGCGGTSSKSVVVYNGQHAQLTQALVSAFEKQTGITVKMRTNDSVVLADQILQEGSGSPADVYIGENSPELTRLSEHGRLAKLNHATLTAVPAAVQSPAGDWVGMALRVSSLAYDPAQISQSQLPASILDLADPAWKGKVGIAPTDSDFQPLVGAVIAAHGQAAAEAWLAGLKHNAAVYQDDEAVVAAVNRGDIATGVINQYYWYRLQLELSAKAMHSRVYYFPNGDVGSIVNVSGAGVIASGHNGAAAQKFVAFLVSPAAQRIISRGDDFEYPARPGIPPNAALPPLDAIAHTSLSVAALGNDRQAAKLIQQAGLAE